MNINNWLENFKKAWIKKDIPAILELFTSDVEYWENPYQKCTWLDEVAKLWIGIKSQKDIILDLQLFSKEWNKYTINFDLVYSNQDNIKKTWKWAYLMTLTEDNKCNYFLQIWE